jgi:hypothetical protein
MPTLKLSNGKTIRYCVMIPSRGRGDIIHFRFKKMPHMNDADTYVGIDAGTWAEYKRFIQDFPAVSFVVVDNPMGSVSHARQVVKNAVVGKYDYYVTMDDNTHVDLVHLENLVRACAEWPRPTVMAGLHRVSLHFDRNRIAKGTSTVNGLRSYESVSMMLVCVPASLWEPYTYPHDAYGLDDRHWYLWMLARGHKDFRVCLDAKFRKPRYQKGGQGTLDERAMKCGHAIRQLATDFPEMVGSNGTLRIPWDYILARMQGATSHRLAMGSTLRTDAMTKPVAAKKKFVLKRRTA